MTEQEIVGLIKDAMAEVAPGSAAEFDAIDLNAKIRDLGIDSVAAMEMVGFVEERLETTFPDEDLAKLNTVADLGNLIRKASA
jgi:acyl carrier protein